MKKKKKFLFNTAILTATTLILKSIGMFFRVYLSNKIGAEGMGLYQLIISVYMLASTFASSGICTAVTRLCSDEMVCGNKKSVLLVVKKSVILSAIVGALLNAVVFFGAPVISNVFIEDFRATDAIKILSFSLVPMGVCSALKGYFMSRRNTSTPSFSSILEQIVRIGFILLFFTKNEKFSVQKACFYVLLADTLAEAVSCIHMAIETVRDGRKLNGGSAKKPYYPHQTRTILKIAIPITAGRYLASLLRTAESLLIPKTLSAYSNSATSGLETFGMLKGMALPLIFFPSSFLTSISTLLIPEISESAALGKTGSIKSDVERTVNITFIGALLAGGCFYACAIPISRVLYDSVQTGVLIKFLSPLVPIMYLESVIDGILKGLNKQNATLLYVTIDSVLRILLIITLVPRFGMVGFMYIMVFSNVLTCSLSVIKLLRIKVLKIDFVNTLLKPLCAIFVSLIVSQIATVNIKSDILFTLTSVAIISIIYFVIIFVTGAVDLSFITRKKGV